METQNNHPNINLIWHGTRSTVLFRGSQNLVIPSGFQYFSNFQRFCIFSPLWCILGRFWTIVDRLGHVLARFGAVLERLGLHFGVPKPSQDRSKRPSRRLQAPLKQILKIWHPSCCTFNGNPRLKIKKKTPQHKPDLTWNGESRSF